VHDIPQGGEAMSGYDEYKVGWKAIAGLVALALTEVAAGYWILSSCVMP
jgi:hypothetical protein